MDDRLPISIILCMYKRSRLHSSVTPSSVLYLLHMNSNFYILEGSLLGVEAKGFVRLRILAVSLLCVLLASTAWGVSLPRTTAPQTLVVHLDFQAPTFVADGDTYRITIPEAPACLFEPGWPALPKYLQTFTLPFGADVTNVAIHTSHTSVLILSHPLSSTPIPAISGLPTDIVSENAYGPMEFYPPQQVLYQTGGGLDAAGKHVTFLTLIVIPAQYQTSTTALRWACNWTITLSYTIPSHNPFPTESTTPLVIITPTRFTKALEPLVAHKIALGIPTTVKTLTDIYREYNGRDKAEQIKFFIKDAVDHWGTKYVLLVGGMSTTLFGMPRDSSSLGANDWFIPVRYSNLKDFYTPSDPGFISDLYYADLYNGNGQFCSWDSNGDGVYGGWDQPSLSGGTVVPLGHGTDTLDFYPDVCVGRLPCRTVAECRTMVDKIIAYESVPASASWLQRILVAAGDPYYDAGTNIYEGEAIGDAVISALPGLQSMRLYASFEGNDSSATPLTRNILRELDAGCCFLLLDGHGGPGWWNTCWPGRCNATILLGGLSDADLYRLHNGGLLPVTVIGGCHCCQFNVTLLSTLLDPSNSHATWSNGHPLFRCLGEALLMKKNGGSIAVIGSTGLGYEQSGENGDLDGDGRNLPDSAEALGGYLEVSLFQAYQNGTRTLGMLWTQAIGQYLEHYPGMLNRDDAKTVEEWVVLGDPSLLVGGHT